MTTVLSYKENGLIPRLYPPFVLASRESSAEPVQMDSSPEPCDK